MLPRCWREGVFSRNGSWPWGATGRPGFMESSIDPRGLIRPSDTRSLRIFMRGRTGSTFRSPFVPGIVISRRSPIAASSWCRLMAWGRTGVPSPFTMWPGRIFGTQGFQIGWNGSGPRRDRFRGSICREWGFTADQRVDRMRCGRCWNMRSSTRRRRRIVDATTIEWTKSGGIKRGWGGPWTRATSAARIWRMRRSWAVICC